MLTCVAERADPMNDLRRQLRNQDGRLKALDAGLAETGEVYESMCDAMLEMGSELEELRHLTGQSTAKVNVAKATSAVK